MSEFVISNTNLSKLLGAVTDKTHKLEIVVNGSGEQEKFTQGSKLRITGEIYIAAKKMFQLISYITIDIHCTINIYLLFYRKRTNLVTMCVLSPRAQFYRTRPEGFIP